MYKWHVQNTSADGNVIKYETLMYGTNTDLGVAILDERATTRAENGGWELRSLRASSRGNLPRRDATVGRRET